MAELFWHSFKRCNTGSKFLICFDSSMYFSIWRIYSWTFMDHQDINAKRRTDWSLLLFFTILILNDPVVWKKIYKESSLKSLRIIVIIHSFRWTIQKVYKLPMYSHTQPKRRLHVFVWKYIIVFYKFTLIFPAIIMISVTRP